MQSQQMTQKELDKKLDNIRLCGVNRGPHDYIVMSWIKTQTSEHASHLLCRTCFLRINLDTISKYFPDIYD
jgi:hypothetical protein